MAVKENKIEKPCESLEWTTEMEVQLFYAMKGHKPVGVNRFFQMACVHEKFNNSINKEVYSSQLWEHLTTMYDMDALNESEIIPFPNKTMDFSLPTSIFSNLMNKKNQSDASSDTAPSNTDNTPTLNPKSSSATSKQLSAVASNDVQENTPKRKGRPPKHKILEDGKPSSPAGPGAKRKR